MLREDFPCVSNSDRGACVQHEPYKAVLGDGPGARLVGFLGARPDVLDSLLDISFGAQVDIEL